MVHQPESDLNNEKRPQYKYKPLIEHIHLFSIKDFKNKELGNE